MHDTSLRRRQNTIVLSLFLLGTACAGLILQGTGCTAQPPQITVEDQYANLSGMFLGAGSVFMKIRNTGGKDVLIGATAALPNMMVELHDVTDNRMVKTEKISIPARGMVELKPRSLHIMLFNMPKSIQVGAEIVLSLSFEKSGELKVPVRFEKPRESPAHGGR
jgi:hypothetical protein